MSEAPEIKIQAIIQLFSLIVNKGRYGMLTDKLLVAKMQKRKAVIHSILFTELDSEGTMLGKYEYDVPYKSDSMNKENYDIVNYPSTASCKHLVRDKSAEGIMITVKASLPVKYGDEAVDTPYGFNLHAILVDKNR